MIMMPFMVVMVRMMPVRMTVIVMVMVMAVVVVMMVISQNENRNAIHNQPQTRDQNRLIKSNLHGVNQTRKTLKDHK